MTRIARSRFLPKKEPIVTVAVTHAAAPRKTDSFTFTMTFTGTTLRWRKPWPTDIPTLGEWELPPSHASNINVHEVGRAIVAHSPAMQFKRGVPHLCRWNSQCSHYCELVLEPEQMPRTLEIAIHTAISKRGFRLLLCPAMSRFVLLKRRTPGALVGLASPRTLLGSEI